MNDSTMKQGMIERAGRFPVLDRLGSKRRSPREQMAGDVADGLRATPKELPPRYFYDQHGSELFAAITRLDEYYQTRTEGAILRRFASEIAAASIATDLVEFGSGNSEKTRTIIDALRGEGTLQTYHPIDVSRDFLIEAADDLAAEYDRLSIRPVVGDFHDGLDGIDASGPALILFLGGTIGNLSHDEAAAFLCHVSDGMRADDHLLIGVDLVKDPARLHAAYNDAEGVTAAFNRNVLTVVNRELGGCFDPTCFDHYAFFEPEAAQIEMHLMSCVDQEVRIEGLDMAIRFSEGETIRTEISRKFTAASADDLFAEGNLVLDRWYVDDEQLFALAHLRAAGHAREMREER